MEQIRSFIAVELPDEARQAIGRVQAQLKAATDAPAKWVDPGSMHLTLIFLGNVGADRIGKITEAMQGAVRGTAPFSLGIGGLGAFPGLGRVQIVWAGVTGDIDRLRRLQQAVASALAPLGFAPEKRPFTPHLTLARLRDRATPEERRRLGEAISGTGFGAPASLEINAVHLMKSQLTPGGPVYSKLASAALE